MEDFQYLGFVNFSNLKSSQNKLSDKFTTILLKVFIFK